MCEDQERRFQHFFPLTHTKQTESSRRETPSAHRHQGGRPVYNIMPETYSKPLRPAAGREAGGITHWLAPPIFRTVGENACLLPDQERRQRPELTQMHPRMELEQCTVSNHRAGGLNLRWHRAFNAPEHNSSTILHGYLERQTRRHPHVGCKASPQESGQLPRSGATRGCPWG